MDLTVTRSALVDLTHRLVTEFESSLAAGSVIRCVARCRDELWQMGLRDGIVEAVEAMARRRLADRVPRPALVSALA